MDNKKLCLLSQNDILFLYILRSYEWSRYSNYKESGIFDEEAETLYWILAYCKNPNRIKNRHINATYSNGLHGNKAINRLLEKEVISPITLVDCLYIGCSTGVESVVDTKEFLSCFKYKILNEDQRQTLKLIDAILESSKYEAAYYHRHLYIILMILDNIITINLILTNRHSWERVCEFLYDTYKIEHYESRRVIDSLKTLTGTLSTSEGKMYELSQILSDNLFKVK